MMRSRKSPRPTSMERRVSFNALANRRLSFAPALILFLLVSCAGPQAVPATSTPARDLTPDTSTPMSTTPTATLTPTVTPDPNMPKGATGKDGDGRYFTVDSGKTYYFLPEVFGDTEFESRMKDGPINLTGYGDSMFGDFTLNFNVYFVKDFQYVANGKHLVHPSGPSDYVTKGATESSLATRIIYDLFLSDTGLNDKTIRQKYNSKDPKSVQQYFTDVSALVQELSTGKTIDVNGSAWEPRKGYDVYWINETDAKRDPAMYFANGLYSKVAAIDGKLVAVLAASGPATFQDEDYRRELLAPLQAVIQGKTEKIWWMEYQDFGARAGDTMVSGGQPITTVTIDIVP